jgi:hypothetical protein
MGLDLDAFNEITKVNSDPDESIVQKLRFDDALDLPHQLTDMDVWLNYCNDELYELDQAVRRILKKTRWKRQQSGSMKTAVPLMFLQIFGRSATPSDSRVCVMLHRLLKYYCTRYTGTSKIAGVRFTRVYHFSRYACNAKRPMSLRLRLEESADAGESNFREYRVKDDKRAVRSRRGTTPHGPLADESGGVPE